MDTARVIDAGAIFNQLERRWGANDEVLPR